MNNAMSQVTGTIYTETVIYSATEAFAADVPYQTAIVSLDSGGRVTGRIWAIGCGSTTAWRAWNPRRRAVFQEDRHEAGGTDAPHRGGIRV